MSNQTIQALFNLPSTAFIIRAYRLLLSRDPDPAGFQHFIRLLYLGYDRRAVICDIQGSREWRDKYSNKSAKALPSNEFIAQIYQDLLNRQPEPSALPYYLSKLSKGKSRQHVFVEIFTSSEFASKQGLETHTAEGLLRLARRYSLLRKLRLVRSRRVANSIFELLTNMHGVTATSAHPLHGVDREQSSAPPTQKAEARKPTTSRPSQTSGALTSELVLLKLSSLLENQLEQNP